MPLKEAELRFSRQTHRFKHSILSLFPQHAQLYILMNCLTFRNTHFWPWPLESLIQYNQKKAYLETSPQVIYVPQRLGTIFTDTLSHLTSYVLVSKIRDS